MPPSGQPLPRGSESVAWWASTEHAATASCACGWKIVATSGMAAMKLRDIAETHHRHCGMVVGIVREHHEALRDA